VNAWAALSPRARVVVGVVTVVVASNLFFGWLRSVTGGDPGGPTSSSYATGGDGLRAYAELLQRNGHAVARLRVSIDEADTLGTGDTLVVADPDDMRPDEADAVAGFVRGGGRLVALGPGAGPALRRLLGSELDWSARGADTARPGAPVAEVAGVSSVEAAGRGSWRRSGDGVPVLVDDDTVVAVVARVDRGRVVAVADSSVLQNAWLDEAGNAAFGLAAAGAPERTVHFAEQAHGYGPAGGLGALPSRWKWALSLGALAGLAWMWSKGRRFGPPDEVDRDLPPPRRAYVDAVAASLSKLPRPNSAVAPLQEAARARLAQRTGLAPDAPATSLRETAQRLGLPDDEIDALTKVPVRDEDVVAAGRALARLEGSTW
jgi:hypothetical protein